MHGKFIRETTEKVNKEKTWQWLSRGDLKVGTEALLCAAQEQAIRTNYIKYHIDKTSDSPMCRLCGKKGESVQHITSGCETLAQKEYKRRYNNVAKKVHWDICKKNGLEHSEKWYEHAPEGTVENEEIKVLWDINIQCDNLIEARRPDQNSDLTEFDRWMRKLGITCNVGVMQKIALLGTARILRKVLKM